MKIYSKNGEYPTALPHRIILSSGTSRTGINTFTAEEIRDAGFIEIELPPSIEYPNIVEWDKVNLQWITRLPNEIETDQKRYEIQEQCKKFLQETDYKVIKAIESGEALNPDLIQYRQALRNLYNNATNIDPWNVQFPSILRGIEEKL